MSSISQLSQNETSLLKASKWWESGQVDSGIILAVLAVVDRPDLVCPPEVYQRVLAERLEIDVSLNKILTAEGRAEIGQQCLAMLQPKSREDLQKWVDVFLEQTLANITTVQSKLRERPPEGGIGWRNLTSDQARQAKATLNPDNFTAEALAAAQLLTDKRIIGGKLFQEGLNDLCRTVNLPHIGLLNYGLGGSQEGGSKNRMRLAIDFFAAQNPETLRQLQKFFPPRVITADARSVATPERRSRPGAAAGQDRLPGIRRIPLFPKDFIPEKTDERRFWSFLLMERGEGNELRPRFRLNPEKEKQIQKEIQGRQKTAILDLTALPKGWITCWDKLICHEIITEGGLWLEGEAYFRKVTAEIVFADIVVVPTRCTIDAQLVCNAIVSQPVAIFNLERLLRKAAQAAVESPVKGALAEGLQIEVDHSKKKIDIGISHVRQLAPYCRNPDALEGLLALRSPIDTFYLGNGLGITYPLSPVRGSKVTVSDTASLVAELSVVAHVEGSGAAYISRLVGAVGFGPNVYCSQSLDNGGRPVLQRRLISFEQWNAVRLEKAVTLLASGTDQKPDRSYRQANFRRQSRGK